MKRLTTIFLLVAAFVLAACTNDDSLTAQSGEVVTMSYTVALPDDIGTRVYSDGETAVYLSYGVYDSDDNLVLSEERAAIIANKTATVEMTLLKGNTYDIVFWADAGKNSNYTINFEDQTVSMNYASDMDANDESRDAFWAAVEGVEASTSVTTSVTLYRPFAQLNFGTDDLSANIIRQNYSIPSTVFTLTMPEGSLAQTFSLKDGSVSNATDSDITFTYTGIPAYSDGEFPISGYEYLQMNYLLPYVDTATEDEEDETTAADKVVVGDDDNPVTLTVALSDDVQPTVSVTNMPLQRNYRTNVYGSLLTNPAVFYISIDETYDGHYCIKDGILYYCVESADELTAAISSNEPNILLHADIEMETSAAITPTIATILNLNGYTLKISSSNGSGGSIGAITTSYDLTILDGALDIESTSTNYAVCGVQVNSGTLTMDNVKMTMTRESNVAHGVMYSSSSTASAITNSSITVSSAGAVVGIYSWISIDALTVENCEITATSTGYTAYGVMGISGTTIKNCTITAEGLISACGVSNSGSYVTVAITVTITNCTVTATATGDSGIAYGIYNNAVTGDATMTMTGSTVTATANSGTAYGIYNSTISTASNDGTDSATITMTGSTVTATGNAAYGAYNIDSDSRTGTITITDSEIKASGTSSSTTAYNAATNGKITIDGEEVGTES